MAQTNIEQQDCPCRQIHDDHAPVRDCTECEGTGTADVEAFDSSGDDDYAWEYAEAGLEARFDLIDAAEMPEVA